MRPAMKFFFSRIFPLIFLAMGANFAVSGVRGLVRGKASMEWPNAQGKVVASSIVGRTFKDRTRYHAEILYEFFVEGTTVSGDRIAYNDDFGSGSSSDARRKFNRYPNGKSVAVYYMPENPEESVLEPGLKAQSWFLPGIGLLIFTIGSLLAVSLPKAIRNHRQLPSDKTAGPKGVENELVS